MESSQVSFPYNILNNILHTLEALYLFLRKKAHTQLIQLFFIEVVF